MCPGCHLIQLLSQNSYILQHLLSCSFFSSPPCHNPNLELSPFSWFFQSATIQAIVMEVSIEDLGTLAGRYSPYKFPKIGYRTSHLPPLFRRVHLARSCPNTPSLFSSDCSLCLQCEKEDGGGRGCPHLVSSSVALGHSTLFSLFVQNGLLFSD